MSRPPPCPSLFPYTTLFRSQALLDVLVLAFALVRPRLLRHLETSLFGGGTKQAPVQLRDRRVLDVVLGRSEEHTSELQSLRHLVCRLRLGKKNKNQSSGLCA